MKEIITFADFQKLDLRVATVLSVEKVENTDKLLKLQIDLGDEKRQLLAGMAEFYTPDELTGKQLVVLTNLEPKKIRGEESQGMLLAADSEGKAVILTPDGTIPPGTIIR